MKLQPDKDLRLLALVLALIGCEMKREASPAPTRQQPSCGDEIIGDEGIGELRIGATVESVRQKCNVVRGTTVIGTEGMLARKLTIGFSRDSVEAEIVKGRVWRIAVLSPHFRTSDSLGVGTPLARLLQLKNPRGMTGEGRLFVASAEHCGISFRLADASPAALRGDLGRAGLARLPQSTVVSEVLVFGCHLTSGPSTGEG